MNKFVIMLERQNRFVVDAPPTGFRSTPNIRKATRFASRNAAVTFLKDRGIFSTSALIVQVVA